MRRPSMDLSEPSRNIEESNGDPSDGQSMDLDLDLDFPMSPTNQDTRDQDARIYSPPPRIADRFYRPSHARRRDSAASSRRNSISSAHSRCSSIHASSTHPDQQSKHVAQHLRRASFLEDRRARLADRAAHAEKVRLRAALAKAAPRGQASEEKALAAQQARDRNLAEIAATCAEEVRKAKQVAEQTKEKREQEVARMKSQLEERMAEAQRRREKLLSKSTSRKSRVNSASKKSVDVLTRVSERAARKLSDQDAARTIQGWWRSIVRRRAVDEFYKLGLSIDGIRDTDFDTVVALLAQEDVLNIAARLLRLCGLQEGEPGSVAEMAACRTFMSAFLILGHPNKVLSTKDDPARSNANVDNPVAATNRLPAADLNNPQLQDLIGKAKDLLISFENILSWLTPCNRYTVPPSMRNAIPEAYAVFYNAFIAWKSRDSNALVEVMLMQFVELDAIYQTVKDSTDDAAAALYRQSIQDSQLMLIVRIKRLAGQEKGKKLIFEAVAEARKARKAKKQSTGDTRPRVADNSAGDASATASSLVSPDSQTLTPPSTPLSRGQGQSTTQQQSSAPKTGLMGLLPDNRVVVHELAINKEYQIPTEDYVEQQAAVSKPLYMHMRAAVDADDYEANFRIFLSMASNIRDKLQRLLKPGNSMYNLIGEILDPELAERQYTVGNFSYEKFFTAMASLLPKLCAPFRDDEVNALIRDKLADGHVIDRVEALIGFIDVMLCDYVNYLMRMAAPQLIESAAQYEAKRFAQEIAAGDVRLSVAENAWREAANKVMAEVQRRDPEGINHPKSRPTASRFYAQMLVDVFTTLALPVSHDQVPEMLRLDISRIAKVSIMVQRIITVGAVLLQCKNLLKRDVRSQWKMEASRILAVLENEHSSLDTSLDGIMAALEAGRSMPTATKTQLRQLVRKVLEASREMARTGVEPTQPVLRLLLTRLRGNILARLVPGSSSASEKVKAANTAGEKLASLGLSEFVDRVRQISDLLDKVGSVDRAAHGTWWDAVAIKVQQETIES
ncbi:IQ calmodulin-binding motif domain-containing protein [Cordyceps javanica]|uniref:IQ calmodulin-binding motif domain-containing protein n=1 Tax=Cordyceps javanica TaxID=43265 RepID=A0A545VWP5_9HYPO|nr:IQ calmodulin-binding motif domain-containing protein [Cordyceps javanica]TQW06141.1 IQ calmodulin-binding motif domain protein [Cordyceps javanica]